MGYYNTTALPIYAYLHSDGHPHYAIADDFFQSAFGGSFLNHQWLIAAATPRYPGAAGTLHSILDSNGMPTSYPLYHATGAVSDQPPEYQAQLTPAALSSSPIVSPLCGGSCGEPLNGWNAGWIVFTAKSPHARFGTADGQSCVSCRSRTGPVGV